MQIRIGEKWPAAYVMPPEGIREGLLIRVRNRFAIAFGWQAIQRQRWWGIRIGVWRPDGSVRIFGRPIRYCIRFAYRTKGDGDTIFGDKCGWHWPFFYRISTGRDL